MLKSISFILLLTLFFGGAVYAQPVQEESDPYNACVEQTIQGHAGPALSVIIDGQGSGIFTDAQGTGPGGTVSVIARSVALS